VSQLETFQQQLRDAFEKYAADGVSAYDVPERAQAVLSHVCFKFESVAMYQDYVAAAQDTGDVFQAVFKGKEVSWCRLYSPLVQGNLALEWIEMVEPRHEANAFNGVTALGYFVKDLESTVKVPSADERITFRYQPMHAAQLSQS